MELLRIAADAGASPTELVALVLVVLSFVHCQVCDIEHRHKVAIYNDKRANDRVALKQEWRKALLQTDRVRLRPPHVSLLGPKSLLQYTLRCLMAGYPYEGYAWQCFRRMGVAAMDALGAAMRTIAV